MIWSRYNTLFHSARFGYFLYNALSNTLLELNTAYHNVAENLRLDPNYREAGDETFVAMLREYKVLVEEGDENRHLLARQYRRHAICFDTLRLGLTICPTLGCNFRCPYCFERSQQDSTIMAPATIVRLIDFIKSFKEIRHLSIAWYGGEPLLAFHVIRDLTQRIEALALGFEGAGIVTNGYLLNNEKIAQLNDLKINSVQITLDGPQQVHDRRRLLAGGGPTFQHILRNIDALMDSSYTGTCTIRVNIDRDNRACFTELGAFLRDRFKGKKLFIYADHVDTSLGHPYDHACCLGLQEWTDFTFDEYHRGSLMPTGGFYPAGNLDSICVANTHRSFVLGPYGELYKCWADVGQPELVVGNIHNEEPITNTELRAEYYTGTDPYNDPECRKCSVLPICGGGCANKRLRAKQFGEKGLEFCSPYKESLISFLEAYIDTFRSREICATILNPGPAKQDFTGFRVISPRRNADSRDIPTPAAFRPESLIPHEFIQ